MPAIDELFVTLECNVDMTRLRKVAKRHGVDVDLASEQEIAGLVHETIWKNSSAFDDLWGVEVTDVIRWDEEN